MIDPGTWGSTAIWGIGVAPGEELGRWEWSAIGSYELTLSGDRISIHCNRGCIGTEYQYLRHVSRLQFTGHEARE